MRELGGLSSASFRAGEEGKGERTLSQYGENEISLGDHRRGGHLNARRGRRTTTTTYYYYYYYYYDYYYYYYYCYDYYYY